MQLSTMSEECIIVHIEGNKILKKEIVRGDLISIVKEYAKKLIDEWDPETSDFIILRDNYTVTYKVPLRREIADKVLRYGSRRVGDKVEVAIPVFEITSSNKWVEGSFQPDNFVIIMPYIDDEATQQVIDSIMRSLTSEEMEGVE